MIKKENIKKAIAGTLSLPKEVVLNLPLISLTGSQELSIENYKGIVEYSQERIRIGITSGIVKIEGRNLALKQITAESIILSGNIILLEFLEA